MSHVTFKMATSMERRGFIGLVATVLMFVPMGHISADRAVTTVYNPGCDVPECKPEYDGNGLNIAYVEAVGENDTLHYLISSIGSPTVLVFRCYTHPGDSLMIDWKKLSTGNKTTSILGAIKFSQDVLYSYGVMFTKLYEYNDPSDSADMEFVNDTAFGMIHKFDELVWDSLEMGPQTNNTVMLKSSSSTSNNTSFKNGSLALQFTAYNNTGRNTNYFPQLLFNDNIIQMDFMIDRLESNYPKSRLGLEMVVTSSKGPHYKPMYFDVKKSIDDEYTPGVFKIVNLLANPVNGSAGGYIQWKPVCYLTPARTRADATYVKTYNLYVYNDTEREDVVQELEDTIMYAYYGENLFDSEQMEVTVTNVSFGIGKDGWYVKTDYIVWTSNIGYGTPLEDSISILVIGIMSAGLGLPVIIILFGGIFVCVKKQRDKKNKVLVNEDKRIN